MKNSPYLPFSQKIPSNDSYTDFLLDILEKLVEGETVTLDENQKAKLEEILSCSFDQVEIMDEAEENIPMYAPHPIF